MTLKFSVITPSYNQAPYLPDALKSIFNQRGDFEIEYRVMDGGSTDGSVEILRTWPLSTRCSKLEYSWESGKDGGPANALNTGFKRCSGDIFYWLNSDDYLLTDDCFSQVQAAFGANPSLQMVTADGQFVDSSKKLTGYHRVTRINKEELLYLDYHILQPATFIRREMLEKYGISPNFKCAFDQDLFTKIVANDHPFLKINADWAAFRITGDNLTYNFSSKRYSEGMSIARKFSKNAFCLCISAIYRYFEIVLKQRFGDRRSFRLVFAVIQRISYRIITGARSYRDV